VQTLVQLLPLVEIGTTLNQRPTVLNQSFSFASIAAFFTIKSIAFIAVASNGFLASLDKATAHQCRTHDWPADTHNIHIEWCEFEGYSTTN